MVSTDRADGTHQQLRALPAFLVLMFWISSWLPAAADPVAILVAAGCLLGWIAARAAAKRGYGRAWPGKAVLVLAVLGLIGCPILVVMAAARGTTVDAGITLFFVLGGVGYLLLIGAALSPGQALGRFRRAGPGVLVVMALWSWASAIGMFAQRGADGPLANACILAPVDGAYDKTLRAVWDMRLPQIASRRTSQNRRYIWDFHAILVVPTDGRTDHYNWSKTWMRFERLDPVRNPYLPNRCP